MADPDRAVPGEGETPPLAASERARVEALVAACVEALERGDRDPVAAVCAASPELASVVQQRLHKLVARGLLPATLMAPRTIGPYRLLRELGSGGMGTVWLGEQHEPVRRRVAIKVLKAGMDTREFVARFQFERQALAAMSHRCIAKVLDGGSTDKGEPYFVMELVEGLPLTTYCDKHRLSLGERLALFQRVCQGVHHAHMKGIVHRDLKPGNVLVAREDDEAVPKVLDFGLAKATHAAFQAGTMFTTGDQMLGTPEYMSPEQAAGDGEAVDSRSDIYSLGVMLYELLSGTLPFSTKLLRGGGRDRTRQVLGERDPQKPSTQIASSIDLGALAEHRRTTTGMLRKALQGDLDWIVLKAMAKEPERRYDSATALAADLERYLRHEPVLAGPPALGYRVRKFVRRHRLQVGAAVVVLLTLVAGIAATTWFAFAATAAARLAEDNAELARDRASEVARQKGKLEQVAATLQKRTDEFDDLAGVVLLDRAIARERTLYPPWPEQLAAMQAWLDGDAARLLAMRPRLQATLQDLTSRLGPGDAPPELESDRYLHDALETLLPKIDELQRHGMANVRQRVAWALRIDSLTRSHPRARSRWADAAAAIAKADGIVASTAYRDPPIALVAQTGLVPIGMNPVTGLWEFYDLRSAWDGTTDPAELPIPEHGAGGSIVMTEATGIVFVLVPGGTFQMGAQRRDTSGPNFDASARPEESPVHEVTLAPFFLARHEITKAQWQRLWSGEDALAQPSSYKAGIKYGRSRHETTATNPAEQLSWTMSGRILAENGMVLPTEAQWEYACRAGTTTVWAWPHEDLHRGANIADAAAEEMGFASAFEPWDDDYGLHAPVGSFAANDFGMFDMHGNVWEWCLDEVGDYAGPVRPGDGLHLEILFAGNHVLRGGSFGWPGFEARSARRGAHEATVRDTDCGMRAARPLRP